MKHGTAGIAEDIIDLFFLRHLITISAPLIIIICPIKLLPEKYNLNRAAISGQGTLHNNHKVFKAFPEGDHLAFTQPTFPFSRIRQSAVLSSRPCSPCATKKLPLTSSRTACSNLPKNMATVLKTSFRCCSSASCRTPSVITIAAARSDRQDHRALRLHPDDDEDHDPPESIAAETGPALLYHLKATAAIQNGSGNRGRNGKITYASTGSLPHALLGRHGRGRTAAAMGCRKKREDALLPATHALAAALSARDKTMKSEQFARRVGLAPEPGIAGNPASRQPPTRGCEASGLERQKSSAGGSSSP